MNQELREQILDQLEEVLDTAIVRHHDHKSDETLMECRLCEEWEGHTENCPIPTIEKFMAGPK